MLLSFVHTWPHLEKLFLWHFDLSDGQFKGLIILWELLQSLEQSRQQMNNSLKGDNNELS